MSNRKRKGKKKLGLFPLTTVSAPNMYEIIMQDTNHTMHKGKHLQRKNSQKQ